MIYKTLKIPFEISESDYALLRLRYSRDEILQLLKSGAENELAFALNALSVDSKDQAAEKEKRK